jgi:hypothetical protein
MLFELELFCASLQYPARVRILPRLGRWSMKGAQARWMGIEERHEWVTEVPVPSKSVCGSILDQAIFDTLTRVAGAVYQEKTKP